MAQPYFSAYRRKYFTRHLLSAFVLAFLFGALLCLTDALAADTASAVDKVKTDSNFSIAIAPSAVANTQSTAAAKVNIPAAKLAGLSTIDFDVLRTEKSALGFAASSDEEFLKAIRQCVFVESANTRTLVFDKNVCLTPCSDITERLKILLKEGRNQEAEAPIWDGCGTFDQGRLVQSWEEAQTQASLLLEKEARLKAKVDSCNQTYDRAREQGISQAELSAMQARLQGEINSLHQQITSELSGVEQKLQNTISYASSVFASQNGLNYVFAENRVFSRCFDLTEPMCKYISKLKMTSARPLEGPNPYRLGVIDEEEFAGYDRSRVEAAAELVRKQKQLRAVVLSGLVRCGAQNITKEVIEAIGAIGAR